MKKTGRELHGLAFGLGTLLSASGWANEDASALAQRYQQAAVTELWQPVVPAVTPGSLLGEAPSKAPSDAEVLFDGTDLRGWQASDGSPAAWEIIDGALVVVPGAGDLLTRALYSDVQLHVEWATPTTLTGSGQGRGNSGIFLMQRYEVQVLDSHENPTYANGQAASVYKQHIPLVNASLAPGAWQSYDIIFSAPVFGAQGRLVRPATVTVLHNGVLVQNHVQLAGPTQFIGAPQYAAHGPASIRLQDHGNRVRYRNIWVRRL